MLFSFLTHHSSADPNSKSLFFWPHFSFSSSGSSPFDQITLALIALWISVFFPVNFDLLPFPRHNQALGRRRRRWAQQSWVFCCVLGFCCWGVVSVGLWWRRTVWRWLLRNRWRVRMNVQLGILGFPSMEERWLVLFCTQRWIRKGAPTSVMSIFSPSQEGFPLFFLLIVEVSFSLVLLDSSPFCKGMKKNQINGIMILW